MKVAHTLRALASAVAWVFCGGCEQPSHISEDQLAFLEQRPRPLFLHDVRDRLGATRIGRDGPYYEYLLRGTKTAVEFWMFPPPDPPPQDLKTGDSVVPVEIAIVVKATLGAKKKTQHVIWPKNLEHAEMEAIWKRIWSLDKPSNQAMQRNASSPRRVRPPANKVTTDVLRVCHPPLSCVARFTGLAVADLVPR